MKHEKIKKLCVMSMLCALAYVVMMVIKVPVILFLKYEPKDVIITFGGFLYGPAAALIISAVVSFIEMLTVSDTGWIGFVMNVVSTAAFSCTAAAIYRKKHTLWGAILGLLSGVVAMVAVMIAWNYLLTPLYMGTPRADVAEMLLPVFLPFNLLKGILNSAIILLLFRPTVQGLRSAKLFPQSSSDRKPSLLSRILLWSLSFLAVAACVLVILHYNGII